MTGRTMLRAAALLGGTGVAAGAFGAHALKDALDPQLLAVFETGARYHLIHALAMLGSGLVALRGPNPAAGMSGRLFLAGVIVFSGSLYLLALTGARWLGAITPIGGAALIGGWIALFLAARRA